MKATQRFAMMMGTVMALGGNYMKDKMPAGKPASRWDVRQTEKRYGEKKARKRK